MNLRCVCGRKKVTAVMLTDVVTPKTSMDVAPILGSRDYKAPPLVVFEVTDEILGFRKDGKSENGRRVHDLQGTEGCEHPECQRHGRGGLRANELIVEMREENDRAGENDSSAQ